MWFCLQMIINIILCKSNVCGRRCIKYIKKNVKKSRILWYTNIISLIASSLIFYLCTFFSINLFFFSCIIQKSCSCENFIIFFFHWLCMCIWINIEYSTDNNNNNNGDKWHTTLMNNVSTSHMCVQNIRFSFRRYDLSGIKLSP